MRKIIIQRQGKYKKKCVLYELCKSSCYMYESGLMGGRLVEQTMCCFTSHARCHYHYYFSFCTMYSVIIIIICLL